MHFYVHKDRHIVVSENEQSEDGNLQVKWVSLVSNVEGSRRGRHPNYDKPIPVADLAPLSEDDVTDRLRNLAKTALSPEEN